MAKTRQVILERDNAIETAKEIYKLYLFERERRTRAEETLANIKGVVQGGRTRDICERLMTAIQAYEEGRDGSNLKHLA